MGKLFVISIKENDFVELGPERGFFLDHESDQWHIQLGKIKQSNRRQTTKPNQTKPNPILTMSNT